ncbi:MAG TPA: glycosyltransferase, partial [Candidatus Eisenbacteria bacterium]
RGDCRPKGWADGRPAATMRRMRVAFVASRLALGGAERITGEVSERLAARGHQVVWLLLRDRGPEGERLAARGLNVEHDLGSWRFDPFTSGRLAGRLRHHRIESAWCLDHQNAAVNLALALRGAPDVRAFLAIHTTGLWGGGSSLPGGMRAALPAFTNVMAVADAQKRYLIDHLSIPAERVVVIRNGVDVAAFATTAERRANADALRATWGIPSGAAVLGVVAALRPEKGHADLFSILGRESPLGQTHLVLVGEGDERSPLEALAARLAPGRIHFLGARADVADILPALDVVVLPSKPLVETLPLSVMEAMAAGRPVVATRVGALEELIEDGVDGRLVPPDDNGALSGTLVDLLSNQAERERLGAAAARRATQFDIERTVEAMTDLLGGRFPGLL